MTEQKEFDWIIEWFYETSIGREVRCLYAYDNGEACMCDFELDLAYLVDKHGKTIREYPDRDIVDGPKCPPEELEDMERDIKEVEELDKAVESEREQWEYGHREGILDALESLLSFRENMENELLLAMIEKVCKRKLFDPPF
jgi:hypothetical protein